MKNKKMIIFSVSDFAKLIKRYFDIDTNYRIEAFCIDDDYKKEDTFFGEGLMLKDLPERVKYARDKGLTNIILNTNGNWDKIPRMCQQCKDW